MTKKKQALINKVWGNIEKACEADSKLIASWHAATEAEDIGERQHRRGRVIDGFPVRTAAMYHAAKFFIEAAATVATIPAHNITKTVPVAMVIEHRLGSVLATACALYLFSKGGKVAIGAAELAAFQAIDYAQEMR